MTSRHKTESKKMNNNSLYYQAGRLAFVDEIPQIACPIKQGTPEYDEWMKGWKFEEDKFEK